MRLSLASPTQREEIYRLRHAVYAIELGQHAPHDDERLTDALDSGNVYLIATDVCGVIQGFVSLTPPTAQCYSLDKYFDRATLPFSVDNRLWEVRLLTVLPQKRGGSLAMLLMLAALRHVEAESGTRIAGIGRDALKAFYEAAGLCFHGREAHSGAVTYELMSATISELNARAETIHPLLTRLLRGCDWALPYAPLPLNTPAPAPCYHGGAFFGAIGSDFRHLERHHEIINADVLDAWFDPAPEVLVMLTEHLPWLLKTSPPTQCEGLISAIAVARGVPEANLVVGAGSSDLIFRAFTHWLTPHSRVLLPDPAYGEYAHVLTHVIGCTVEHLPLARENHWKLDSELLAQKVASGSYDLCILIHPSNPTGTLTPRAELAKIAQAAHPKTRLWIDEAYMDYVGAEHSLETLAAMHLGLFVCKSLSKVYALSGARAAYLSGPEAEIAALRRRTPPWAVSLPAQVAAVQALTATGYYQKCWTQTHSLRTQLATNLRQAISGCEVEESVANWLLLYLPTPGPNAAQLCAACAANGLFLRDLAPTSARFGTHAVRIAVKDAATNRKIVALLTKIFQDTP